MRMPFLVAKMLVAKMLAAMLSASACRAAAVPAAADCAARRDLPGDDIVLLAGQSNMAGYGVGHDPTIDSVGDPRIVQLDRDGQSVVPATEPLRHPDRGNAGRVGLGLAFARSHLKTLPAQRRLLLVPAAFAATGFLDRRWNPGDDLFEAAVLRTNAALARNAGNCVLALLWHQGEADYFNGATKRQYAVRLDRLVRSLRERIPGAAQAPFVLGQLAPQWLALRDDARLRGIAAAIDEVPQRLPQVAVVRSDGLASNRDEPIHFSAAAQREFGRRYADALSALQAAAGHSCRSASIGSSCAARRAGK